MGRIFTLFPLPIPAIYLAVKLLENFREVKVECLLYEVWQKAFEKRQYSSGAGQGRQKSWWAAKRLAEER